MGLNDDLGVDIDPGVEPFPLPKSDTSKPVSFKVTDSVIDESRAKQTLTDVFSNGTHLGELPNLDAEFKICLDGVNSVVSMRDIETDILSEQTISQESAKNIEAVYGGFLGERFSIEEFSLAGSKTNYSASIKFINASLDSKETQVGREIIEFYKSTEGIVRNIRVYIESVVIPYVEKLSDELLPKYNELMDNGAGAVNAVLPMKDGNFQNILTEKLNRINFDHVDYDNIDEFFGIEKEEFKTAFTAIQESLKSPTLVSYIHNLYKESESLYSSTTEICQVLDDGFSINELIAFFNTFFKYNHRLGQLVSELKSIETFYGNQSNELDNKFQTPVGYVSANYKSLMAKNTMVNFSYALAVELTTFLPLVNRLFFIVDKLET